MVVRDIPVCPDDAGVEILAKAVGWIPLLPIFWRYAYDLTGYQ